MSPDAAVAAARAAAGAAAAAGGGAALAIAATLPKLQRCGECRTCKHKHMKRACLRNKVGRPATVVHGHLLAQMLI
jgi:hypothetical protein